MRRLLSQVKYKLLVLMNGRPFLYSAGLVLLALSFLLVMNAVTAVRESEVKISVFDECGGESSRALCDYISSAKGLSAVFADSREEAENAVYLGKAEAALVILPDYDRLLASGSTHGLISLAVSPSSVSTEIITETVAGGVMSERARLNSLAELSRGGYDTGKYAEYADEFVPPYMVTVRELSGSGSDRAVFGRTFPGSGGFYALALMLVMLTVAKKLGGADETAVSRRYSALPSGRAFDLVSDLLALFVLALFVSAAAFIFLPEKSVTAAFAYIAYAFAVSGLSLFASSLARGDRLDAVSPVFALVTSIIGGCFIDFGALPKPLAAVSRFTLQGQLIASVNGQALFIPVLIILGVLFAILSRVRARS
ncbi:MAG: ABC transporter permease [Clostridiales bacterium]|nr:ABC transporter permease [Clostridiales bacterium]